MFKLNLKNRKKELKNLYLKFLNKNNEDLLAKKVDVINQINQLKKENKLKIYVIKFNGIGTWIDTINANYMSVKYHLNAIQDTSELEPSIWFKNCFYLKQV
jgi:hypothetical protein